MHTDSKAASPQARQTELLCSVQDTLEWAHAGSWYSLILHSLCKKEHPWRCPALKCTSHQIALKMGWILCLHKHILKCIAGLGPYQIYFRLLEVSRDWLASLHDLGTESLHVSEGGYFTAYNFSHWVLDILSRRDGRQQQSQNVVSPSKREVWVNPNRCNLYHYCWCS